MAAYYRARRRPKKSRKGWWIGLVVGLVLAAAGTAAYIVMARDKPAPRPAAQPNKSPAETPKEVTPKPPLVNLQPVVDSWVAKQSGDFGIAVYDPANQQLIAQHQADKQFFTASIYKLYVVYLTLQDVEAGKRPLDGQLKFGKSRQQCLHDAIHTSDSPCAEALLAEIGTGALNDRLTAFGFTGTSFPSFVTSANDSVKLLERLQAHRDLSQTSTNLLLEAMKTQVYRNGLPKGLPQAMVYDKVGFSETPHYHDVAIITLPNGREYLVAILSEGAKSRQVADFGAAIFAELNK